MAITRIVTGVIEDGTITSTDMAVDPRNASNLNSGDVPLAQLDNVEDTFGIQADVALLAFKTQANGSLAKYNLVDQSVDAFEDATGISASDSTNEVRNSAGKYYSGSSSVVATGGTITTDGDYKIHSFSQAQSGTNYVTDTAQTIDYLIIGGGGGGGAGNGGPGDPGGYRSGGGAGAGGYRSFTGIALPAGTFAVVVGAGGPGGPGSGSGAGRDGTDGGVSSFNSQTSAGGGAGGGATGSTPRDGHQGASGGGASASLPGSAQGGPGNQPSTSPAQGYAGSGGTSNIAGAGGGASEAGGTDGSTPGGHGGDGLSNSITGAAVVYAGGGSGGSPSLTPGGDGGGGSGPGSSTPGGAGTDGLGGGGGGAGGSESGATPNGGDGGNGIVIIRRPTATQYLNMTLESITTTTATAPTKGDLVFTYTNGAGTAVLGTNITAEYSADAGSTWTDFGIGASDSQGTTGGHTIVTKNNVSLTSTSGTNMRFRIKTLVQSVSMQTRIHAVSLGWS